MAKRFYPFQSLASRVVTGVDLAGSETDRLCESRTSEAKSKGLLYGASGGLLVGVFGTIVLLGKS